MANRQSYPTSALFITIAVAALATRMLLTAAQGNDAGTVLAVAGACGLFTASIGVAIGMHSFRRAVSAVVGAVLGFVIGAFLGPLILVREEQLSEIVTLQLAGSLLLLGSAVFFWVTKSDPLTRRPSYEAPVAAALTEEPSHSDPT